MAGEIPDLHATVRAGTGKGAARQARRDGLVPGVVYGGSADPVTINLPFNELMKRLKAGRFLSTLFNLKVDGHDDVRVICRSVQRDVVKDLPTHVDFMRLHRSTKVNLFIPVEFTDEKDCPGIKRGGVLTVVRPEIELVVTAGDIPEKVEISLAGLDINDHISISMVKLPEGTKATIDRDFNIASISAPSGLSAGGGGGSEDEEEETEEA
ncbi:50S ribosomal protein L25/general stress protein Ctc [Tropicimonas sp. IMCC6043]|uniref:50S ribosomal protein L25/general stress protein Ctc n=1 Tax=Tropicimonas sp. IMCC6043 TaxID=2510645 RepID=UPI00101DF6AE|nr:50S ribosomal protein L25/general stress protein Ctc [Tropicimonas sp. IMCC6043]RYH09769.1 50S ribosomal protein L25/general stress protein Ctc [Tropicimonas sp. IMCC6043]